MSDRIVLTNMRFQGRHGYYEHELLTAQPFEVDVELVLDLQRAGMDDDLTRSVDYGRVYESRPGHRRIRRRSACWRRSPKRSATRSSRSSMWTRSPSGSASRPSSWAVRLDHAGVEIRRRRGEGRAPRLTAALDAGLTRGPAVGSPASPTG